MSEGVIFASRFIRVFRKKSWRRLLRYFTMLRASRCLSARERSRFLPFEEAREYARSLGFTVWREWLQHCKNNRPSNVPSCPSAFYKTRGWIKAPDWLGYEKRVLPPRVPRSERANKVIAKAAVVRELLISGIERRTGNFEFLLLRPGLQANVLFRKRTNSPMSEYEDPSNKMWLPLQVKTGNRVPGMSCPRYSVAAVSRLADAGVIVLTPEGRFCAIGSERNLNKRSFRKSLSECALVGDAHQVLERWWEERTPRSGRQWLIQLWKNQTDVTIEKMNWETRSRFYHRCGMEFIYRSREHST